MAFIYRLILTVFHKPEKGCILILPNTKIDNALFVAESLRKIIGNLAIPHAKSKVSDHVTLSLGITSLIPTADQSLDHLISKADAALYKAKNQGRNRAIALP